jgi:diguanylate cyclase (GGDEF)-like protein
MALSAASADDPLARRVTGTETDPTTPDGSPAAASSSPGHLPASRHRRASGSSGAAVLIIQGCERDALLLTASLSEAGSIVHRARCLQDAVRALQHHRFDFVLSDLSLPDATGLDCVRQLHPLAAGAPLIVLTGIGEEDLGVQAIQAGAQDYLMSGQVDPGALRRTLRHARERKRMQDQLVHLTRHDALTGAVNRAALREHVAAALIRVARRDTPLAVMYLDLDRFKVINDHWGHDAGDTVLREVVVRLRSAVRSTDVVARLGGDEFAVLLDDFGSRPALHELAQRILRCLEAPIELSGARVAITGTIGVACSGERLRSADDLLSAADSAMYRAKRRGRNHVLVAEHDDAARHARELFTTDLHHALERGELVLHFQPQFAVMGERLVGFEALLRWQRPGNALVPPSEFIALLEDSGGIIAVGEWVIERACEQLAAWRSVGRSGIRIAVNLSARQFAGEQLVEWTRHCLQRFDVPARCLELEITETNLMANTQQTCAILAELRALGVRLAIDDFGTGFSSLAYLSQFAVDCLKIDRSLIEQLHVRGDGEVITNAIIALGHHLGLEIVAEGVETEEQLASLTAGRCDLIQGYLLGHPTTAQVLDASAIWSQAAPAPEPATTTRLRRLREAT